MHVMLMAISQKKISGAQYVVLYGQTDSTTLLEGIMKNGKENAATKAKLQKGRAAKSRGKPVDLLDISKPRVRNIFSNYIESGMDRAFNFESQLLENAVKHNIVSVGLEHKDPVAVNEMQKLICTLKSIKRSETPGMELVILDTSYINSIVRENGSVKDAIIGLHETLASKGAEFEIILTKGVFSELVSQLNDSKKDEFGRRIMTSEALDEIHELVYGGRKGEKPMLSLEHYSSTEESRKELSQVLGKRNRKGNVRCGAGDTSILECIKDWSESITEIVFDVLTLDSDLKKIVRGCKVVRVLKSFSSKRRRRRRTDTPQELVSA